MNTNTKAGPHVLPALPFSKDALAPVISARTLDHHYDKHHKGYVDTLNKLVAGTPYAAMSLEDTISATAGQPDKVSIFNNAAQAWNHGFYWRSLKPPGGGGEPTGALKAQIEASFGGATALRKVIVDAAKARFGSGWVWLVQDGGKLAVIDTANADVPATQGKTPLLVVDVWEHAYYLDYQERRADHVERVVAQLLNWDFAADNLAHAR